MAFGIQILVARLLGVSGFGNFFYALTWLNVLGQIGTFGQHQTAIRYLAMYSAPSDIGMRSAFMRHSIIKSFMISCLLASIFALVAYSVAEKPLRMEAATLIAAAPFVPVSTLFLLYQGILRGLERAYAAELIDRQLRPIIMLMLFVFGYWLEIYSLNSLVAILIAGAAVTVCLLVAMAITSQYLSCSKNVVDRSVIRMWRKSSEALATTTVTRIAFNRGDTLLLGVLASPEIAGIYIVVQRLSELAALPLSAMNAVIAPKISELHYNRLRHDLQRSLSLASLTVAIGSSLVTGALLFAAPVFLGWYGEEFGQGFGFLVILLVAQLFNSLCGPVQYILTMTGEEKFVSWVFFMGTSIVLLLDAILIMYFGGYGAAFASASAMICWNLIFLFAVKSRIGVDPTVWSIRSIRQVEK